MDETPQTEQKATARVKLLRTHVMPTAALAMDVSKEGDFAVVGCMDGVYYLDMNSGETRRLYEHDSYVSGVSLANDDQQFISAGYDGKVIWFDRESNSAIRAIQAHSFWSWQSRLSPNGRIFASVSGQYLSGGPKYEPAPEREPSIVVFDATSGEIIRKFSHLPPVQSVAFSPDSSHIAAGNLMGTVRVWNLASGELASEWNTPSFTCWGIIKSHCYIGGIFDMEFSPDGEKLVLCGMGEMRDPMAGNGKQLWQRFAWRESPARLVDQTQASESGEGLMETIVHHPSGDWFVMGGRLRGGAWNTAFFRADSGSNFHQLKTDSRITRARFSEDGKRLYLAGTKRQPEFVAGAIPAFGHVNVYSLA